MAASAQPPTSLILLTSTQAPLPTRYPHPHKPRFVIPPLVHRTLHDALDTQPSSDGNSSPSPTSSPAFLINDQAALIIPHPDSITKHDIPATENSPPPPSNGSKKLDTNLTNDGITSEADTELTVKLHLVGQGSAEERCRWVEEALGVLSTYKGLGAGSVDTLLVGWKGVDYKGKKTAVSEFFGCGAEGLEGGGGGEEVSEEVEGDVKTVWGLIGESQAGGRVKRLGTMYLPLGVLKRLADKGSDVPKPQINMLDTPDCHHLPHEYSGFAKENGIELWAGGGGEGAGEFLIFLPVPRRGSWRIGGAWASDLDEKQADGPDPLPDAELHNLLQEFSSPLNISTTIPALIPLRADELKYDLASPDATQPGVRVKWVLGYTLLSKARNVVKDRGYIISASF